MADCKDGTASVGLGLGSNADGWNDLEWVASRSDTTAVHHGTTIGTDTDDHHNGVGRNSAAPDGLVEVEFPIGWPDAIDH